MIFPIDLQHFQASEFTFPDSMNVGYLRWLDRVRQRAGVPFHITNDFRPGGKGLHGLGMAVDVDSRPWRAARQVPMMASGVGFTTELPESVRPQADPGPTAVRAAITAIRRNTS